MTKVLLLDLDGTVRQTKSGQTFINEPYDQKLIPGIEQALSRYPDWSIVGVTNQKGVACGFKTLADAIQEQKVTIDLLQGRMSHIYFCPDDGETCVRCGYGDTWHKRTSSQWSINRHLPYPSFRKPSPGMLLLAIDNLPSPPSQILMVGDRPEDAAAAKDAEVPFIWAEHFRMDMEA